MTDYDKFEKLCEILGQDTFNDAIMNWMSSDELENFCNSVIREYDLDEEFDFYE